MRTSGGSERLPDALPADTGHRRRGRAVGGASSRTLAVKRKQASDREPAARTAAAAGEREQDHAGPGAGSQGANGRGGDGPGPRRDLRRETAAFGAVAHRILQEEDLDAVCRLFLETVRQHSGYRRAVLTLFDEQGRDVQLFFTGFSDEEIDYFHAHKPGAEQRAAIVQERFRVGHSYIAPAADCEGGGLRPGTARDLLFLPLLGPGSTLVGAVMLFEPVDDTRPAAEDLSSLELFAGQVAHAVQKRLLDQKIKAMQARLLAVEGIGAGGARGRVDVVRR